MIQGIPFTKRDANGKIIGNFAAIQREQLIAFRQAGLARGSLYVGMCLQVDFPFANRPFEVCVEKFCERWLISRSQYYLAMEKLRKANFLSIIRSKIFLCFNNPGNGTQIPETGNQIPETGNQIPENENQIPENENQIPENENHYDSKTLWAEDSSAWDAEILIDNLDVKKTFLDCDENEKTSEADLIADFWVEAEMVEEQPTTRTISQGDVVPEIRTESFVEQQNSSSGSNVPLPPVAEKISNLSTDEPKYTKNTQRAIASYESSGVIPKGMELVQWAVEAIGGDVQLYRQSGRILSFKPNDIDRKFLKFLELRLTGNKAGKTANPTAWINAMERDPSRWGELTDLVGAWQREEFLNTAEGKAATIAYNNATQHPLMAEISNKFSEYF
jgi:hypothetical protein